MSKRLSLNQDIKPLSEFRAHAASFIEQVHQTKRPIVITQHGHGSAVLMDVDEYDRLLDTIEMLQEIQQAETEIKLGKGISGAQARKQILQGLDQ